MTTQTLVNDVQKAADLFVSNMGNAKVAAQHFSVLLNATVTSRDTNIVARAVEKLTKRGDKLGAASVRSIMGLVFPGAKLATDKATGRITIKIKDVKHDQDAVDRFNAAIAKGLTLRDTLVKATRGEPAEKDFVVKDWAARTYKAHPDQLEAMIAALQAMRKDASVNF